MSVSTVIAAALVGLPGPATTGDPLAGLLRFGVRAEDSLNRFDSELRALRVQLARAEDSLSFASDQGGYVIRRYLCDEHGVVGHDIIHRRPEIHPTPGESYEADLIIGPDAGLTPEGDGD